MSTKFKTGDKVKYAISEREEPGLRASLSWLEELEWVITELTLTTPTGDSVYYIEAQVDSDISEEGVIGRYACGTALKYL